MKLYTIIIAITLVINILTYFAVGGYFYTQGDTSFREAQFIAFIVMFGEAIAIGIISARFL